LLDEIPKSKAKKILAAANELRSRLSKAPNLDLRAKKKEINGIVAELVRDEKRSQIIKERSNKDVLLYEAVECLVSWMSDVWVAFYEFDTNYSLVHSCLLFTFEALARISAECGG
jgi:hypothetical protein